MTSRAGIITVALLLATGVSAQQRPPAQDTFPHLTHARLFPLCDACHAGISSGVRADAFPTPANCASCHDGQRVRRVSWSGRAARASNLNFAHPRHILAIRNAGDSLDCAGCHSTGDTARMAVGPPDPNACTGCHAHQAPGHLSPGRDCSTCHLPLTAATSLSAARVSAFPKPASHQAPDFLLQHAPGSAVDRTSCATCHARESCARCHLNADSVPAIAALGRDARVAALARDRAPVYPQPASHSTSVWRAKHGAEAVANVAQCANCHARSSCTACHRDRAPPEVSRLPVSGEADQRGVVLPARVTQIHPAGFVKLHGPEAATMETSCQACHASAFCEKCHAGPVSPSFHAPNFLARHGPDVYANDIECTSCHNPEVFCRACHAGSGLASRGRLGVAFHTANPLWIVGHGGAARQGLEGCASCHQQSFCTQCHSATAGWRINPHGPGFNAAQIEKANPLTCRLCHAGGPPR